MKETGLVGKIKRFFNIINTKDGSKEYAFLVDVLGEQQTQVGYDPEIVECKEKGIKDVC